jgi:hypothetical protein
MKEYEFEENGLDARLGPLLEQFFQQNIWVTTVNLSRNKVRKQ